MHTNPLHSWQTPCSLLTRCSLSPREAHLPTHSLTPVVVVKAVEMVVAAVVAGRHCGAGGGDVVVVVVQGKVVVVVVGCVGADVCLAEEDA